MAGDSPPKPGIPAWQRAQPSQADNQTADANEGSQEKTETQAKATQVEDAAWQRASPVETLEKVTEEADASQQRIELAPISTNDFEAFQRKQKADTASNAQQQQTQPQRISAPPIITYPEFLVEAHKPPPLITPARIWNTAYAVGGLTAVLYGASKYLVGPMSDSLSGARHDFAMHSLSKIDELNERLSKLVSKVPEPKNDLAIMDSVLGDETESEASDPAELYHRNIGTQTSPEPSRTNSMLGGTRGTPAEGKAATTPTDHQVKGLNTLKQHLSEMVEQSAGLETANKARQDKMDELMSYLDTTIFASPHVNAWSSSDFVAPSKNGESEKGKEDAVEAVKKEIRAVKGLMLSAKRFPGVAGRVNGTT